MNDISESIQSKDYLLDEKNDDLHKILFYGYCIIMDDTYPDLYILQAISNKACKKSFNLSISSGSEVDNFLEL